MRVPLLDLKRQYASLKPAILAALERVCDAQQFILGPEVEQCERDIAGYIGGGEAVGCSSGTDAIWLALVAAGVEPGGSVLTTPFSFFASTSAIVRAGARPVFADVDPRTLNLSPESAEKKARGALNLQAILPVHLYGQCADMDALSTLAAEHKCALIEDAAQAFGAAWRGRRAGALGAAAACSFYPTKNLSAFGEAGCVTTQDAKLASRARSLRNHGSTETYHHDEIGWNCRLDALQAAVLRVKLAHLEKWNGARRERAALYDKLIRKAGLVGATSEGRPNPVQLLATASEAHHIYHQYVIRAARRDELRRFLAERGVESKIFYPVPLHLQKCFRYLGHAPGDLPEAERAAEEVLALPMFAELSGDEQSYVVEMMEEFYS
jgi:dTDP-4-amino-4,6-dideoxygalactose transaminase